jgi:hypothetical protein
MPLRPKRPRPPGGDGEDVHGFLAGSDEDDVWLGLAGEFVNGVGLEPHLGF